MKPFSTLCLTMAASACLLGAYPAAAQEYGYPERCRARPHHATYSCDRYQGYGYRQEYGYPSYPVYAQPYGGGPYGPPPYAPYGGYGFRQPHHAFYGGYGYGGGDADY